VCAGDCFCVDRLLATVVRERLQLIIILNGIWASNSLTQGSLVNSDHVWHLCCKIEFFGVGFQFGAILKPFLRLSGWRLASGFRAGSEPKMRNSYHENQSSMCLLILFFNENQFPLFIWVGYRYGNNAVLELSSTSIGAFEFNITMCGHNYGEYFCASLHNLLSNIIIE